MPPFYSQTNSVMKLTKKARYFGAVDSNLTPPAELMTWLKAKQTHSVHTPYLPEPGSRSEAAEPAERQYQESVSQPSSVPCGCLQGGQREPPGSCTSSPRRNPAAHRPKSGRPSLARLSPVEGTHRAAEESTKPANSASWRSPSNTARSTAATSRSTPSWRCSSGAWHHFRVCHCAPGPT